MRPIGRLATAADASALGLACARRPGACATHLRRSECVATWHENNMQRPPVMSTTRSAAASRQWQRDNAAQCDALALMVTYARARAHVLTPPWDSREL
jgi:hypothetical protein